MDPASGPSARAPRSGPKHPVAALVIKLVSAGVILASLVAIFFLLRQYLNVRGVTPPGLRESRERLDDARRLLEAGAAGARAGRLDEARGSLEKAVELCLALRAFWQRQEGAPRQLFEEEEELRRQAQLELNEVALRLTGVAPTDESPATPGASPRPAESATGPGLPSAEDAAARQAQIAAFHVMVSGWQALEQAGAAAAAGEDARARRQVREALAALRQARAKVAREHLKFLEAALREALELEARLAETSGGTVGSGAPAPATPAGS